MKKKTIDPLEPHYRMLSREHLEPRARHPVHVVLENIRSAFNVGSIFRTSDAGAVEHIHLCGYTCHPPNLKLAKTALGAFDYVPWTHHEDSTDAVTPELLSQCDEIVRIPMLGYKNSINVATAFGIVLYDILGQWGALREPAATAAPRNRTPAPCPGEDQ